ncbi:hypothetical protein [Halobacteriovorax sp.]|uniref:hypothetical protein n=1 Tax=Halobacteriovorax sp. TaxID=2020862 RepID=UPI003AF2DAFC
MKKDILYILTGNTVLQVTSLLSSIIISIYYTPKALGEYSLIILTSSILATFYTLRAETLILIEKSTSNIRKTYSFAKNFSTILFCITTVMTILSIILLKDYYFMLFLPFLSYTIANQLIERELFFIESRFKEEAIISGSKGIINNILQIVLKSFTNALIVAKLISEASYVLVAKKRNSYNNNFNLIETYAYFKKNKDALLGLTGNRLLQNISNNGFHYITSFYFGLSTLGLLTLGMKLIQLPGNMLGEALSKIFEKYQQSYSEREYKTFTIKFYIALFFISIITSISIGIVSYLDFFHLLPKQWGDISKIALILSPLTIPTITNAFIISCYKISNKISKYNKIEITEGFSKSITLIAFGIKKELNTYIICYVTISLIFSIFKFLYYIKNNNSRFISTSK